MARSSTRNTSLPSLLQQSNPRDHISSNISSASSIDQAWPAPLVEAAVVML
uniref:Uncharacterized protein n=1 Tax=Arundo donax TaxID=35708 RepID=A0A0A9C853_ARUDO